MKKDANARIRRGTKNVFADLDEPQEATNNVLERLRKIFTCVRIANWHAPSRSRVLLPLTHLKVQVATNVRKR